LQFAVAGPVVRGMAWLIDVTIRSIIWITFVALLSALATESLSEGYVAVGLFLIMQFMISWFYTTLFEAMTGTTPGKKMFGLWVVHDNATPITWSGALIRNFLRVIDNLPFIYVVGLVSMLMDNRFRRLGDLAAGTLVIYRDKATETTSFAHDVGLPPPEWLTRDDRQAVVDFAERSQSLSPDRQQELANILSHLVDEDADTVHTLKSWAHWILQGQTNAQSASV